MAVHILITFPVGAAGDSREERGGFLCVYTLKNPASPERVFHTSSGVTSIHFHPEVVCLVTFALWKNKLA